MAAFVAPQVVSRSRVWNSVLEPDIVARKLPAAATTVVKSTLGQGGFHHDTAIFVGLALSAAACIRPVGFCRRSSHGRTSRLADGGGSASDRLLWESLSKETNKMKSGTKRSADDVKFVAKSRPARPPPRPSVSRSSSGGSQPSLPGRILSLACWLPPLCTAIPFGVRIISQVPLLQVALVRPLMPVLRMYLSNRYSSFICIIFLHMMVAQNKNLPSYTRTIGMQASTLMMMQIPFNFLLQFFSAAPTSLFNLAQGAVFFYYLYCVGLGVMSSWTGQAVSLPGIGDGRLPSRMPGGGMPGRRMRPGSS